MKTLIHLNQIGYLTNLPKTAVVAGKASSFCICEKNSGKPVFAGLLGDEVFDAASGETVFPVDFSSLAIKGEYYLKAGNKKSPSFKICQNPFREVKKAVLKSFFLNRCGMPLHSEFAGEYRRKKCHIEKAVLISNPQITLDVRGGWHDSGNYCRYVLSGAVALAHMLYAYELFPESFKEEIKIPESGNGIPDILNECRWELEWLIKMQDKDGGVFYRAAAKEFPANIMPHEDCDEIFVYEKTASATAAFCAVCALASRIFSAFDKAFADELKKRAEKAWLWAVQNKKAKSNLSWPASNFYSYGDSNPIDKIFWAAAEMHALTGSNLFEEAMLDDYENVDTASFSQSFSGGFGALSFVFSPRAKNLLLLDAFKTAFTYKADTICAMSKNSAYKTAVSGNKYLKDSNFEILSAAMVLIIANKISPNEDYVSAAIEQLNYILGKNPMGISYVTGFGEKCCQHPHHRPSTADGIDAPPKGLIVCGPNMEREDEYIRWLIPKGTPPAKCYVDKEYSYSTNETSLYTSACLLFVLGFFS